MIDQINMGWVIESRDKNDLHSYMCIDLSWVTVATTALTAIELNSDCLKSTTYPEGMVAMDGHDISVLKLETSSFILRF